MICSAHFLGETDILMLSTLHFALLHPQICTTALLETIHSRFTAGYLQLRGQKGIFVGTLNVRTLREEYKRDELGVCMRNSGVQILGIQEHRIVHGTEIGYQELGNCYLITSSA